LYIIYFVAKKFPLKPHVIRLSNLRYSTIGIDAHTMHIYIFYRDIFINNKKKFIYRHIIHGMQIGTKNFNLTVITLFARLCRFAEYTIL